MPALLHLVLLQEHAAPIASQGPTDQWLRLLALGAQIRLYRRGAAGVATVDQEGRVEQRFFRGRPGGAGAGRDAYAPSTATPTPSESRNRTLGLVKDAGIPGPPFGAAGRDWSDSPTGRSTTAKDRVKSAASVALSSNGRWLAVGEYGYRPRILIFSLTDELDEAPVTVLAEHTFGVHALSFSSDSRYLASLGAVNDGFLFVWNIDDRTGSATLHASNKCTTLINDMEWMGNSIITVGLRFVKVWRPDEEAVAEGANRGVDVTTTGPHTPRSRADNRSSDFNNSILSPKHKPLYGKNSLLGEMLEANVICVLPISNWQAIVCAESGEICLLDDVERAQSLTVMAEAGFAISAARLDGRGSLHVTGVGGQKRCFAAAELQTPVTCLSKQNRRKTCSSGRPFSSSAASSVVATGVVGDRVVELRSNGAISVARDDESDPIELAAHDCAILGVQNFSMTPAPDATFLTFSVRGEIRIWHRDGTGVAALSVPVATSPEMYGVTNELKAVTSLADGRLLACGDRYGTLTMIQTATGDIVQCLRAHAAEITDMTAFQRDTASFVATASRDRTVQLFALRDNHLELIQTLDEHAGAVTSLLSLQGGDILVSASADRSIVVRDVMLRTEGDPHSIAYGMVRAIALKSAPTSICAAEGGNILVATTDRSITKYPVSSGQPGFTFKCSDPEGGEAVVMSKILYASSLNGNPTIIGVGSSEKSVRLYTDYGALIARDWGHTEGITGLAVLAGSHASDGDPRRPTMLVTVAADSTIFIWDTMPSPPDRPCSETHEASDVVAPVRSTLMIPPLRKVISHAELSRYRREESPDACDPQSPTNPLTHSLSSSPYKLRKKPSRTAIAQAPKLEPPLRPGYDSSRRRSVAPLARRSPSPPSPFSSSRKKEVPALRPALNPTLRPKSTDPVASPVFSPPPLTTSHTGFGTLTASTESVCRTLRAYRKKLVKTTPATDPLPPDTLRELERELKLTARVLSEKSQGRSLDEVTMARLLDQASERLVGMLDERIRERVDGEVGGRRRRSHDGSPVTGRPFLEPPAEVESPGSVGAEEAVVGSVHTAVISSSLALGTTHWP
ncbi:mitogen-activated protein kinase-binding protein 1-like [Teratosphaeria destructans]|uniref:Mitogen-activated protein kinase-binding protein 1-like n=1 Tax=Teratosphaeria destructans TaxID=418781 RepID=A0A9W7SRU8_9PEZI|nr:mitogen-activated protein kinase-binding protein 1-like [Teratosphaeria destructans]